MYTQIFHKYLQSSVCCTVLIHCTCTYWMLNILMFPIMLQLLITAVNLYGAKNWSLLQEYVPGRTATQCRDRYIHCLDPSIRTPDMWTYEEDKKLLQLVNKKTEEGKLEGLVQCIQCIETPKQHILID